MIKIKSEGRKERAKNHGSKIGTNGEVTENGPYNIIKGFTRSMV